MKAPAFQFYAQDFLTGCTYLTNEEIGMYIKMLCKQWTDGRIPIKRLEFLVGAKWENLSQDLKEKFEFDGEFLHNKRLEIEREKQKEKSEKAKISADKRWKKPAGNLTNKKKSKVMRTHDKGISEKDAFLEEEDRSMKNEVEEEKEVETEVILDGKINFEEIVKAFNEMCPNLPSVQKLTTQRKIALKNRISEHSLQVLGNVFKAVSESQFLNGTNERSWTADFDWILKPANFIKIIEGRYKNKNYGNTGNGNSKSDSELKAGINNSVDKLFGKK